MLRTLTKAKLWGWSCEATWTGRNHAFTITLPTKPMIIIQSTVYHPERQEIEIKGYYIPENNIDTKYKDELGD